MTQHDDELYDAAVELYLKHEIDQCCSDDIPDLHIDFFKAGARWQAEKSKELVAENVRLTAALGDAIESISFAHDEFVDEINHGNALPQFKSAINQLLEDLCAYRKHLAAPSGDALNAIREAMEALALMAEGEGSDEKVYMQMSKHALAKLREVFGE